MRSITFTLEDFAFAFAVAEIETSSLTDYEWRKFEEAFLAGARWDEVAVHAAEVVALLRQEWQP